MRYQIRDFPEIFDHLEDSWVIEEEGSWYLLETGFYALDFEDPPNVDVRDEWAEGDKKFTASLLMIQYDGECWIASIAWRMKQEIEPPPEGIEQWF